MIDQRQFEPALAIGFGQTAAGRRRIHLALMLVVNHQILKPHQLHRGDALVCAVEKVLDRGRKLVGKHLFNPVTFHRGGETEQREGFRSARLDFANRRRNKQRGVLHHALAHQRPMPAFSHIALQRSLASAQTKLVEEPGQDALEERVAGRFRASGFENRLGSWSVVRDRWRLAGRGSLGFALRPSTFDQAIPPRQQHDLCQGLIHLPGGLRMNAVAPALLDAEVTVPREMIRSHQGEEIRFLARLEQLTRPGDVLVVTAESHQ